MIGMSSSAKSFGALAHYLANGRSGNEPERVAWSASRNLPTSEPELAGKIMRATDGITVNGTPQSHSRPLKHDFKGRGLPQLGGSYVVRQGYTWLLAPSDRSFDSRYLGELSATNIVERVQPCWTLGKARLNPRGRP